MICVQRISVLFVVLFVLLPAGRADDEQAEAFEAFRKEAAAYRIEFADQKQQIHLNEQSLLNWTNPTRNGENGSVFLWTAGKEKVPVAVGTCFTYTYRGEKRYKHALHTLTSASVRAFHQDRPIWTPRPLSDMPREFPKAPDVAVSVVQRSQQLRQMARRFQVDLTDKKGQVERCRLVPRPLYRFGSKDGQTSGALFSFAVGTDPEALLLLERQKNAAGKSVWHYSLIRFTFYPLEASLDGSMVWNAAQSESLSASIFGRTDYQLEPYITFRAEWLR